MFTFPYEVFVMNLSMESMRLIVFCATTLGTFTYLGIILYLLFRKLENEHLFAPLENMLTRCKDILTVGFSAGFAFLFAEVLKNLFAIPRPFFWHDMPALISVSGYGFPSQHAAVFGALAMAVFLVNKKVGVAVWLITIGIGIARILAGVHSPLDVLGGFVVGAFSTLLVSLFVRLVDGKK